MFGFRKKNDKKAWAAAVLQNAPDKIERDWSMTRKGQDETMKDFIKPKPDDSLKKCPKLYLVYGALIIIPLLIGLLCLAK